MKKLSLALLLSFISIAVTANEKPLSVETVKDWRSTVDCCLRKLEVELELDEQLTQGAQGVLPLNISSAKSDLGEDLLKEKTSKVPSFFNMILIDEQKPIDLTLELKSPSRSAKKVFIEGDVTIFTPTGDPTEKVVINNYLEHSGKELNITKLLSRNIDLTFFIKDDFTEYQEKAQKAKDIARKENRDIAQALLDALGETLANIFSGISSSGSTYDLTFIIEDEEDQIYKIELYNDKDELIAIQGKSTSRISQKGAPSKMGRHGFRYEKMLPYQGYLVIYLRSEENTKSLPFDLKIDLP